jgi:hypothetical protein
MGAKKFREILEAYCSSDVNKESAIESQNINVIQYLWDIHYYSVFSLISMTRLTPLILFMCLFNIEENVALWYSNMAYSLFVIAYEIYSMRVTKDYFKSVYNWIDLIGHVCGFTWLILTLKAGCYSDEEGELCLPGYVEVHLQVLWTFALTMRAMDIFKMYDDTRQLFSILVVSAMDCIPFLLITGGMIVAFAIIKAFLKIGEDEVAFYDQLGVDFAYTMGGWDSPDVGEERTPGAWTVFFVLIFITNLIVLNTLIAILGNSFDNVMTDGIVYDMREKIALLLELHDFQVWNRDKVDNRYIHIIRYVSQDGEAGEV